MLIAATLQTKETMTDQLQIAVIHTGDAAAPGEAVTILTGWLIPKLVEGCRIQTYALPANESGAYQQLLLRLADEEHCPLIISVGEVLVGGVAEWPLVMERLCPKPMPGFGEQIRRTIQRFTPVAMLLLPFAGIRRKTVMIHLPAEPDWLAAILPALFPAIPNAVFLATGLRLTVRR